MSNTINVVLLYVGNEPKGLWRETDVTSYKGKVWWDYIRPITITHSDWVGSDIQTISMKYVK